MSASRGAMVVMLVAVECFIAGFAIWTFRSGSVPMFAESFHQAIAGGTKPVALLALGASPHVVVSDPDSRIEVRVSGDRFTHVRDVTSPDAYSNGTIPPLKVTRTADGALVERAAGDRGFSIGFTFGDSFRETEIDVPPGARVEIQKSAGADVGGLRADLFVRSQDGHISVDDHDGNVDARSDDGQVVLTNVKADSLKLGSSDGRIELHDVTAQTIDGETADGRLIATNLTVAGASPHLSLVTREGSIRVGGTLAPGGTYQLSTSDGRVDVGLAPTADLAVDASADNGAIYVDGTKYGDDDGSVHHTLRLGSGAGTLRVSSGDGSVHITTNGAF